MCLLLGLLASLGFASPAPAFQTPQPLQPQIILVIDVSGSMAEYVIPDPPPDELRELLDKIYAVENLPEITALEDQLDAILEQPEIKAALFRLEEARFVRLKYIQENLGVDLFDRTIAIETLLEPYQCAYLAASLMDEASVAAAREYAERECANLPSDVKAQIESQIAYLDDSEVSRLYVQVENLSDEYSQLRKATQYDTINSQLNKLYRENNYYDLTGSLDEKAAELGLPSRLDFAKSAADSILDLVGLDFRVSGQTQRVGLVIFTTYAKMIQPLTADIEGTRAIIEGFEPLNSTNLGGGLEIALDMADASPNPTTIILLSDGWSNTGVPRDTILSTLTERARTQGTRICSAGFGTREDDVDKELLETLATSTDGKYLFTSSGGELVSFFIACRQSSVAENVTEFQGAISPGQTVEAGRFLLERGNAELTISLNFIEGDLDLLITDPNGTRVAADYPGLTQLFSPGLKLWTIQEPEAGEWNLQVTSGVVNDKPGIYYVVVSTKPGGTNLPDNLLTIGLVVLIGLLCAVIVLFVTGGLIWYARSRKKA